MQEITAHRKKFDESIFDVAFHPSRPFIASAGADALAKVFVWSHSPICSMKYPFPKLLSNADKTHEHKDLKSLVLNVTDNTESMLTADFPLDKLNSKNKTKLKPKEEQESERTKLSSSLPLLNASSGSFTDINRMIESSSVETLYERRKKRKTMRSLGPSLNDTEDKLPADHNGSEK